MNPASSSTLRLSLYVGLSTILMLLATLSISKAVPFLITLGRRAPSVSRLIHLAQPSIWLQFLYGPSVYIARLLYGLQKKHPGEPLVNPVSVVCVSDTHNTQPSLPNGDILVHAGDLTRNGTLHEIQAALDWLNTLPHEHKIVVAGNHDTLLERLSKGQEDARLDWGSIIYLEDEATVVVCANGRTISVYGSPRSPRHGSPAFQYPRGEDVWSHTIPDGVDILITHTPPRAHLDLLTFGCVHLLRELWRTRPKLHVVGHVHEARGIQRLQFDDLQEAYEDILLNKGGLYRLYRVVKAFLRTWSVPTKWSGCVLVNACAVGGWNNAQRRAEIVMI